MSAPNPGDESAEGEDSAGAPLFGGREDPPHTSPDHGDPLFISNPELNEEYTSLLMGQDSPASAPPTARATTPLSARTAMPDPKAQDPLLQRRALTIALVLLVSMILVGFILIFIVLIIWGKVTTMTHSM